MADIFEGCGERRLEIDIDNAEILESVISDAGLINVLDYIREMVWREYVRDRKRWDIKVMYEGIIRGTHAYLLRNNRNEFRKLYGEP